MLFSFPNHVCHSFLLLFCEFVILCGIQIFHPLMVFILLFAWLPCVYASQGNAFQDTTFEEFSSFILQNFDSNISLSTVLLLLFSVTENHDLLSLHANQQLGGVRHTTGWIRALSWGILQRLDRDNVVDFLKGSKKPREAAIKILS